MIYRNQYCPAFRCQPLDAMRASFLCVVLLLAWQGAAAQTPTIELKTARDFIYVTGKGGLQPFIITVNNPQPAPLTSARFEIRMPASVFIGALDRECAESVAGGQRILSCEILRIDARSTRVLDFYVDGPLSAAAAPGFTMTITSANLSMVQAAPFETGLADGDATLRGNSLNLKLLRDIGHDGNGNGMPDLDEVILNPPPGADVAQLLQQPAMLDVLFLHTPAATTYLGDKLALRVQQLLTATNQIYRENDLPIRFRGVGLSASAYAANTPLSATLAALQSVTDPAFAAVPNQVVSAGADLVVLLHALQPGTDTRCSSASLQGIGRQGDFQSAIHRGQLLTVVNVGPDCLDLSDLAAEFAANMGVVADRTSHPDGGTFSHAAGYGVVDGFTTLGIAPGSAAYGSAQPLKRFSSPDYLCLSQPCGINRNDLARGADAMDSLRRTRHVISALSPTVFPVTAADWQDRPTPGPGNGYDLDVVHATEEAGALQGAFTRYHVTVTNPNPVTLYDMALSLVHLDRGIPSQESQTYRSPVADPLCRVLGNAPGDTGVVTGTQVTKSGRLSCFIEQLAPGESLGFGYWLQIDASPPTINGQSYYQEAVMINGVLQNESVVCLPVYANLLLASQGSNVCALLQDLSTGTGGGIIDLNALPSITGNLLTLPFVRLFDGSLYSVDLQAINYGQLELQVQGMRTLNSALLPAVESSFDDQGVLRITGLHLGSIRYDVQATYLPDTEPARFGALQFTEIITGP